jgi:hypothetical protein
MRRRYVWSPEAKRTAPPVSMGRPRSVLTHLDWLPPRHWGAVDRSVSQ